jgi:hypothetical protein
MTRKIIGTFLLVLAPTMLFGGVAYGKGGASVKTPFETAGSLSCTGELSWSVKVGSQAGQWIQVRLDVNEGGGTIGSQPAYAAGTYSGTYAVDPSRDHTVLFRRVVEGKVEEAVSRTVSACV